jgi:hypothetical protein
VHLILNPRQADGLGRAVGEAHRRYTNHQCTGPLDGAPVPEPAENLNGGSRDEFLNGETFCSMRGLEMLAERWRVHCGLDRDSLQPIEIGAPL